MGEVGKDVTNLCGEMIYFLYLRICPNNARFLNMHIMINEAKCRFFDRMEPSLENLAEIVAEGGRTSVIDIT